MRKGSKTRKDAFDTLNADMIFNIPGQTPEMLDADLASFAEFKHGSNHLLSFDGFNHNARD